jgi:hypothetical protein
VEGKPNWVARCDVASGKVFAPATLSYIQLYVAVLKSIELDLHWDPLKLHLSLSSFTP